MVNEFIAWFKDLSLKDIPKVGGKNASLGEMLANLKKLEILVPEGFALTTQAYHHFLKTDGLETRLEQALKTLRVESLESLAKTGKELRSLIMNAPFPKEIEEAIAKAYNTLAGTHTDFTVAVRSSATAEDLIDASFAGQQETFLNIKGIDNILEAVKKVYASLFNDRAISYRLHHKIPHDTVAISVGIQQLVRSDEGASGVAFTLDTESGFDKVIFINAGFGLGELVVQGAINPDEYHVFKPFLKAGRQAIIRKNLGSKRQRMICQSQGSGTETLNLDEAQQKRFALSDNEIEALAKQCCRIEDHYGRPMDIEWAKAGDTNTLYILQARPETVKSRLRGHILERYALKNRGKILVEGRSVGNKIGQGQARVIHSLKEIHAMQKGEVLVTDMTDPDWEPVMKRAAAIVTNRGGRTCHAAIVARELGIPAVVGCGDATSHIQPAHEITVSCAEGETGYIYEGLLEIEHQKIDVENLPPLPLKIMMTVANPERAFDVQRLPNQGVGLARLEFMIAQIIGIHPKACLEYDKLSADLKQAISNRISGYRDPVSFYVEKLSEGIATIASAFWPKPVIARLSDFKSNEYANLLGGHAFEPKEENPMLGFRGASRYLSPQFKACFELECRAFKKVREEWGFSNVEIMVPFVRTLEEAKGVVELLAKNGLKRGEKDLRLIMMCELPVNVLLASEFLEYFDGFSIGSNDLTQLTLGIDRDSSLVAKQFDERHPAILKLLEEVIRVCKKANKYIGICGQGPSDHPDFAVWLLKRGIDSLSLNPDSVISTGLILSENT